MFRKLCFATVSFYRLRVSSEDQWETEYLCPSSRSTRAQGLSQNDLLVKSFAPEWNPMQFIKDHRLLRCFYQQDFYQFDQQGWRMAEVDTNLMKYVLLYMWREGCSWVDRWWKQLRGPHNITSWIWNRILKAQFFHNSISEMFQYVTPQYSPFLFF